MSKSIANENLTRRDCEIAETKLTQIHTYRNGVFEESNYRTTHFRSLSRHSFLTVCRRGNDNTCLPGIKEEKWCLPNVDKTRPSFHEPNEKTSSLDAFYVVIFTRWRKLLRIFKKLSVHPLTFSPGPSFRTSIHLGRVSARAFSQKLDVVQICVSESFFHTIQVSERDLLARSCLKIFRTKFYSTILFN